MTERNIYTLYQLTSAVRMTVEGTFEDAYWVSAEITELRVNASGHCYLELVDKRSGSDNVSAKTRAMIWNSNFPFIKSYFEETTGQAFTSGLKILVKVKVTFHEVYGFALVISGIDPSFTMGDMALRRRKILEQLKKEGILDMNKEIPLPDIPRRVAVISSATAAGYGDFRNQLAHNERGFSFQTTLFPAVMQGERVEKSMSQALDHIYNKVEDFDVVVIIRGGGATADLACFDSLPLAEICAQFPLPVITGIGHERDTCVLDYVAHTRVKTPTAAAELLIHQMEKAADRLTDAVVRLASAVHGRMETERNKVVFYAGKIPLLFSEVRHREENRFSSFERRMDMGARMSLTRKKHGFEMLDQRMAYALKQRFMKEKTALERVESAVSQADPQRILRRGYSLTTLNGKVVMNAKEVKQGDRILTRLSEGTVESTIN